MLKARNPPLGLDSKFEKYRAEAISKVEELHKSPYVDGSLESASELGKEVKGLIKDWELAWLSCFGGKAVADIVKKAFLTSGVVPFPWYCRIFRSSSCWVTELDKLLA